MGGLSNRAPNIGPFWAGADGELAGVRLEGRGELLGAGARVVLKKQVRGGGKHSVILNGGDCV